MKKCSECGKELSCLDNYSFSDDKYTCDICLISKRTIARRKDVSALLNGLADISKMPCIYQLLGEAQFDEDGSMACGCASCIAKMTLHTWYFNENDSTNDTDKG